MPRPGSAACESRRPWLALVFSNICGGFSASLRAEWRRKPGSEVMGRGAADPRESGDQEDPFRALAGRTPGPHHLWHPQSVHSCMGRHDGPFGSRTNGGSPGPSRCHRDAPIGMGDCARDSIGRDPASSVIPTYLRSDEFPVEESRVGPHRQTRTQALPEAWCPRPSWSLHTKIRLGENQPLLAGAFVRLSLSQSVSDG